MSWLGWCAMIYAAGFIQLLTRCLLERHSFKTWWAPFVFAAAWPWLVVWVAREMWRDHMAGFLRCTRCRKRTRRDGSYERGWRIMWLKGWERPETLCHEHADEVLRSVGVSQ